MKFSGKITRPATLKNSSQSDVRGRAYQWECVTDPSFSKDFFGKFFRRTDLGKYGGGFPAGTVFVNKITGKRITT
ncbi:MAG: hypothetical protein HN392_11325 [Anaerolineae bacterium]|jgi:hypothetical protein|nr:hypothetical protein [Anaerolineae bacterium]